MAKLTKSQRLKKMKELHPKWSSRKLSTNYKRLYGKK